VTKPSRLTSSRGSIVGFEVLIVNGMLCRIVR